MLPGNPKMNGPIVGPRLNPTYDVSRVAQQPLTLNRRRKARVGFSDHTGQYRLVFRHEDSTMEFFGTYLEVTPHSRLVWTNEEGDNGKTVTTVTFDENAGKTFWSCTIAIPRRK